MFNRKTLNFRLFLLAGTLKQADCSSKQFIKLNFVLFTTHSTFFKVFLFLTVV